MRVALVCIAKDEDNYIEEWIDYHSKLGFDNIFIYENDWVCNIERPFLTKIPFPGKIVQLSSYNDFLIKNKHNFDWVAFFDVDEFLVLKQHKNIKDFLTEYDNPWGIAVNWVFFGSDGLKNRIPNCQNSLIKQFVKREKFADKHIKTILKLPSESFMISPHNPNQILIDTQRREIRGPFNFNGDISVIQLNHYHHKTYEDWHIKCNRGFADGAKPRVLEHWTNAIKDYVELEDCEAFNFMYKKDF
jgi:hypothetical protein